MMSDREGRPRVVLADDHPSVLVAFGRMLSQSCDVIASVPNGSSAVDVVCRLRPDVLVVDLMMSDLDGLEICRRVKQTAPETRVVIVTAFDDSYVQTIALQSGASAFIPKHSAARTLARTIRQVCVEKPHTPQPRIT
jgi:NarL family two-component system response regulator LiaR